ncbi:MAG: hypothetical protein AB7S38_41475 [Vulcanimicrobiota bacterium]
MGPTDRDEDTVKKLSGWLLAADVELLSRASEAGLLIDEARPERGSLEQLFLAARLGRTDLVRAQWERLLFWAEVRHRSEASVVIGELRQRAADLGIEVEEFGSCDPG